MSLDYFAQAHHVVFGSPFSPLSTLEAMLDGVLERQGVRRKLGVRVASVLLSPYMVAHTSLVALLPRVLARHYAGFLPLRVLPAPFELPPIEISMVWHERTHRVSMQRWVRGLVREVVEQRLLRPGGHVAGALAPHDR